MRSVILVFLVLEAACGSISKDQWTVAETYCESHGGVSRAGAAFSTFDVEVDCQDGVTVLGSTKRPRP